MARTVLGEIPLELLPQPQSSFVRPPKRTLSPGQPSPFLPAKRRFLSAEGAWSPELSIKKPMHPPHPTGRRLDFTEAENAHPADSAMATTSAAALETPPILIPRKSIPQPSDPNSPHWPGFHVHTDTHAVLPQQQQTKAPRVESSVKAPIQLQDKENVVPRRPSSKANVGKTPPSDDSTSISTPRGRTPFTSTSLTPQQTPESVALSMLARGTPDAARKERKRRVLGADLDDVAEMDEAYDMSM